MTTIRNTLLTITLLLALAPEARANPWVLPEGIAILHLTMGAQTAREEYLPDGARQVFPLDGHFDSYFLQIGGRYGLGSGWEISARGLLKGVTYSADAVVLGEDPGLLDFDQRALGLGDLYLGASHQHLDGGLRLASEVEVKLPTGYQSPRETFLAGDPARPGDDVTLGDGQVDLSYALQAGWVFEGTGTLAQGELGYRKRLQGPGDQGFAGVKLGQSVTPRVFLFAGVSGTLTLFEGEPLGTGLVAIDPTIPAERFTVDNVREVSISLDRDFVMVEGGAILRFEGREVVISASQVLWGSNFPRLTGASVGTLLVFD
jgi:hypothetical protein